MCNQNSKTAQLRNGEVTAAQKAAIKKVLDTNAEVASYYHQSKEQAFDTWKRVYIDKDKSEQAIYSTVDRPPTCRSPTGSSSRTPTSTAASRTPLSGTPGRRQPSATCARCSSRSTSG